jgi:hypothetical protein
MRRMSFVSGQEVSPISMNIGQTAYVCVYADRLWNDSGVDVASGQAYNFTVPNSEKWIDWRKKCGAGGYTSTFLLRPWESFRRVPEANWLQLIGTIGRSTEPPIAIGSQLIGFSPPYPGRLYFYANDLAWTCWNNKGVIAVRVTRTK